MTIVEFLTARLDEEARRTTEIHAEDCDSIPREGYNGPFPCDCGVPTRLLTWIAVERAIIHQHGNGDGAHECPDGFMDSGETEPHTGWELVCMTQRHLAMSYAGHPDYQHAWR